MKSGRRGAVGGPGLPGTRRHGGAKRLGGLVEALAREVGKTTALESLAQAWSQTVGPEIDAETRVSAFRKGVLEVEVASAALLGELSTFYREVLLGALRSAVRRQAGRRKTADLRGLRFRLRSLETRTAEQSTDRQNRGRQNRGQQNMGRGE